MARLRQSSPMTDTASSPSASAAAWLEVESLDLEAQGVAHDAQGKVVFIEGALPGEQVQVEITRRKPQWERGRMTARRRDSAFRVTPPCPHFGVCGGCAMQHLDPAAQVAVKQRVLDVIAGEDKRNPLSDDEIADKLQDAGLDVKRRTVTKYRKTMNIPSSRQRRES